MNATPPRPTRPVQAAKPTTEQLRSAIDSGATGSKIAASDPAASPLGTDDEAAGHPPSHADIGRATVAETAAGVQAGQAQPDTVQAPSDAMYAGQAHSRSSTMVFVVIAIISVLAAIAVFLVFGGR